MVLMNHKKFKSSSSRERERKYEIKIVRKWVKNGKKLPSWKGYICIHWDVCNALTIHENDE